MFKRWKLRRIARILGNTSPEAFVADLSSDRHERAFNELLAFCESDSALAALLRKHRVGREQLTDAYQLIVNSGAGQWISGQYVPVASLTCAPALDFLLSKAGSLPSEQIALRLLDYFERSTTLE
jgi:hypothetical protein